MADYGQYSKNTEAFKKSKKKIINETRYKLKSMNNIKRCNFENILRKYMVFNNRE